MKQQSTILVVDDEPQNISFITWALKQKEYKLMAVTSGKNALEVLSKRLPDLILLDIMMPETDGYEVCRKLKADVRTRDIPVIFITAVDELDSKTRGFELGAVDYITKPFEPVEVVARVQTHLELKQHRDCLEKLVQERTRELEEAQVETVNRLGLAAEYRDEDTGLHILRIREYSQLVGREMDIPLEELNLLVQAAPMHDVGKIGIPDHILLKPGKLTPEEFEVMKTHTTIGAGILSGGKSRLIQAAEQIALTHHEKWDGSGYPNCLKGEDIPLFGRIVALADVYDALTTARVYKPPFSHSRSAEIIISGSGSHFSPMMIEIFLKLENEFEAISRKYADSSERGLPF